MSQKRRRASMAFRWHKSLTILAPWRKGKCDMVLDSEVVLTKVKLFENFHENLSFAEDSVSTISMSVSEQDVSGPVRVPDREPAPSSTEQASPELKPGYLPVFSDGQLPRLFKFESEDSGVELPSGANSPSTPTGSEHSFVLHSRESSCDSRDPSASAPVPDPHILLDRCPVAEETAGPLHPAPGAKQRDPAEPEAGPSAESSPVDDSQSQKDVEAHLTLRGPLDSSTDTADEFKAQGTRPRGCESTEALDEAKEEDFQQKPLRKSTTSNSLDEYMEECCRLSEVHQEKSGPLGSGLGYLEHICQLIEKIAQLQEHNIRLQKQVCGLQKESWMRRTKEEFLLQHCLCGAAGLALQEPKRASRSEFHSLTASNGALSDLSTIPEVTRQAPVGESKEGESGGHLPVALWRKGLNRRSYTEGEARHLCDSTERLSIPQRRLSDNHPWGRVKELVKKTRMRNQSRLGLDSSSLKRSCPQLYRPDLGPVDLPGRNRNSMISLGPQTRLDFLWPH